MSHRDRQAEELQLLADQVLARSREYAQRLLVSVFLPVFLTRSDLMKP